MPSAEFAERFNQAQAFRGKETQALRGVSRTNRREYLQVLSQNPEYQAARDIVIHNRWEKLAQKVPEFSQETWEIAERLFSGINNGVKAALFLDIAQRTTPGTPGTYLSTEDIVSDFRELFAGTELLQAFDDYRHIKQQVVSYCQNSLSEVGLLTRKLSQAGKVIGFGVTEDGQRFGRTWAQKVLRWEYQQNQSLYYILGPTHSSGETRAPLTRARVLDYLARHPINVRNADLKTALGMMNQRHLIVTIPLFADLGLVEYKAITPQTGKVQLEYQLSPDQDLTSAPYISSAHILQDLIVAILTADQIPVFSIADIVQRLPEDVKVKRKEESLRRHVSEILSGLARRGYLSRVNQFKGAQKQSDMTLLYKGRALVLSLLWPMLLTIEGQSGPQPSADVPLSPKSAQISAELYYPYSKSYKQRRHLQVLTSIVEVIKNSGRPLTNHDLAQVMGLSVSRIGEILRPHIKGSNEVIIELAGQPVTIKRTKIKGVTYYSG